MKSRIITIGDEILIGQITDTNSPYIAQCLNDAGFAVEDLQSVGDDAEDIAAVVEDGLHGADIIIVTGGLGPTKDDITKYTLAGIFGGGMKEDPLVLEMNEKMLSARGIPFNGLNRSQAMVPAACTVLPNHNGTAPGMWFERDGKVLVSLPGVPFEMSALMDEEVMPRLKERFKMSGVVHKTMVTTGIAESMLAEKITGWENGLPEYLRLAYLPGTAGVKLRLSFYGDKPEKVIIPEIDEHFGELYKIIPENILGFGDVTVQSAVAGILLSRNKTLSVAESCTGGYLSSLFTQMPGASEYFSGGAVTYSNGAKIKMLGVNKESLEKYGAVSRTVAEQMAEGMRCVTGSDYAVSTTGIAGPSGGTPENPVGTVWIAVAGPEGVITERFIFGKLRLQNIERTSATAINMLRLILLGERKIDIPGGVF